MIPDSFGLNPHEKRIARIIRASYEEHGYPPTMRELAVSYGCASAGNIAYHIGRMEARGLITREKGKWRSMKLAGVLAGKGWT